LVLFTIRHPEDIRRTLMVHNQAMGAAEISGRENHGAPGRIRTTIAYLESITCRF
jgi:hypothetical protein